MSLDDQINEKRQEIQTDAYPMSIGEVINIYRDGELDIHPEFQRVYRWTEEQKTRLIESIFLGIPLPSFFVSQRDDGVWDVIDGLQRLSTIFSFVGICQDENENTLPPLVLKGTDNLSLLEGMSWESDDPEKAISKDLQRAFKREKIDLKIIKKESGGDAKYELFQRLNTGGSKLSDQEVRNCLLLMLDPKLYEFLKSLANSDDFLSCLPLTQRQMDESYHMEIALRYFIYKASSPADRKGHFDIGPYITQRMKEILISTDFDVQSEEEKFLRIFRLFNEALSESAFKRFNRIKNKHEGAFSILIFEGMTAGLLAVLDDYPQEAELIELIKHKSETLPDISVVSDMTQPGVRAMDRFPKMIDVGKEHFSNNED